MIGPSGSGKSSFLRAGLTPTLQAASLSVQVMVPGRQPYKTLSRLGQVDVVIVDQVEEIWTHCSDDERSRFLECLGERREHLPVYVIGMRADFFSRAAQEAMLQDALTANPVLVKPLTVAELREVIVEPARKAKWTVEDSLVQLLMAELTPRTSPAAAHDLGVLPFLSHALRETWQHSGRRRMTIEDYLAIGGITGAVEQSAEAVFATLTGPQRQIAQRVFLRLINVDDDTRTRRRVDRAEMVFGVDTADDVQTIIDRFTEERLLTSDQTRIEIAHETLIGAWDRLTGWADDYRDELVLHRRLTHAAQLWHDTDRDPTTLLSGARLEAVQTWAPVESQGGELNQRERDYIEASLAHQRRTQWRERARLVLTTTLVIVLIVTVVAQVQLTRGRAADAMARDEAMSRQVAYLAISLRERDPALSAQLALASYRIHATLEARSALLDTSSTATPIRLLKSDELKSGEGALTATDRGGHLLAIGRADGSVTLHRMADTRVEEIGHITLNSGGQVYALELDPTGRLLAAAGMNSIELWDVANPQAPRSLSETTAQTHSGYRNLALSPDGTQIVAALGTTTISRWDITDPKHPVPLHGLDLPAGDPVVTFSSDGRLLAAAGNAGALRIWERARPDAPPIADIAPDGSTAQALSLRFSPDSAVLAVPGRASEVRRWDVRDPAHPVPQSPLRGFTSYVNDVAFSPDGTRLAAISSDSKTRVWRLDTDQLEMELPNPSLVVSVRFAMSGRQLVTGGVDGAARIWPLPGPVLRGAQSVVFQTPIDHSGKLMLAGTGAADGNAHLWNLGATPVEHTALPVGEDEKSSGAVALALNGLTAAVGTRSGHVLLWDLRDPAHPRLRSKLAGVDGIVSAMTFTPDAKTLVVAGQDDPAVTLWDLGDIAAPRPLGSVYTAPGLPGIAAVDAGGTQLAIATSNESVYRWDIRDRTRPRELPKLSGFTNGLATVAFSPTAPILAAGSMDHTVKLFDLSDPEAPRHLSTLTGAADAIIAVNFGPDGTRLVGGASDNGIWVWDITDLRAPQQLATLSAYPGRANDVVYGLDGRVILAAGPDRTIRMWTAELDQAAAELCSNGSTPLTAAEWKRYLIGVTPRDVC
ncbi:WD40 repeat domain-containing protein [Nocardia abscessus]|nr:WD40 repeat domain-containing protein [Nocardia abscessus]